MKTTGSLHRPWRSICALAAVTVLLASNSASAFKTKAHVVIANQARAGLDARRGVLIEPFGYIRHHNDEVTRAIAAHPEYFRAGAIGPDGFPDLVAGQIWVHVDKSKQRSSTMEALGFDRWRSIDNGMHLWRAALGYRGADRAQALAFAAGYLSHMGMDAFAHDYVNIYAGGAWDFGKGSGLFGSLSEEIKHLAVETYLDGHLKASRSQLRIKAPIAFLQQLYAGKPDQKSAPGKFGGEYYYYLTEVRDVFHDLADRGRWGRLGSRGYRKAHQAAAEVSRILSQMGTLGTEIGDPFKQFEHYFQRREQMMDALLGEWIRLSECINQNLLYGTLGRPLREDACASADFESSARVKEVFGGTLNQAAHHGKGSRVDYGGIPANFEKMVSFVTTVVGKVVALDPTADLHDVNLALSTANKLCNAKLVKWKSCDKACKQARKTCKKVVERTACLGCPKGKKKKKYSCKGVKKGARCAVLPHCVACAGLSVLNEEIDSACKRLVNSSAPICDFCSDHQFCEDLNQARRLEQQTDKLVARLSDEIMKAIRKQLEKKLLPALGSYFNDIVQIHRALEEGSDADKVLWTLNLSFLAEDLQNDPDYLDRILQAALGQADLAVPRSGSAGAAANTVFNASKDAGTKAVARIIKRGDAEAIYKSYLTRLVYISRNQQMGDFPALKNNGRHGWLDSVVLKGMKPSTRLGKFLGLTVKLGLVTGGRGPTAERLHGEMQVKGGRLDMEKFHVVYNAVQATRVGFLALEGFNELRQKVGMKRGIGFGASASGICGQSFHPFCDGIQSLDDPNRYGQRRPANTLLDAPAGSTAFDPVASLPVWESYGGTGTCRVGRTAFMLAWHDDYIRKVYRKLFKLPPGCRYPSRFEPFQPGKPGQMKQGVSKGAAKPGAAKAASPSVQGRKAQPAARPASKKSSAVKPAAKPTARPAAGKAAPTPRPAAKKRSPVLTPARRKVLKR